MADQGGPWNNGIFNKGNWGLLTLRYMGSPPFVGKRVFEKTQAGYADKDGITAEAMGFEVVAWMPLPRAFDSSESNTIIMEWKVP